MNKIEEQRLKLIAKIKAAQQKEAEEVEDDKEETLSLATDQETCLSELSIETKRQYIVGKIVSARQLRV